MSEQEQLSKKQELIEVLKESIDHIQHIPDEDIEKRNTKMNAENGVGYLLTTGQFHMWIVKIPSRHTADK